MQSEAELVAALRAGDQAAFARLVDMHSPPLLRMARMYVSSDADAEEVVQDTWLAVIDGIDRFEGRASLRTWVYRILTNIAKTRGVRERRTVPWTSLYPDEGSGPTVDPALFQSADDPYPGHWRQAPAAWPSPERAALSREVGGWIEQALTELPPRQRIVITLRDVEGYTSDEVCSILDVSPANQRVLLHRARAAVRGRLAEHFEHTAERIGYEEEWVRS
jgi:RNA polymerase sigma-70 factor (ECF subfamily)